MSRDIDEIGDSVLRLAEDDSSDVPRGTRSAATKLVEMALSAYDVGLSEAGEHFVISTGGPPVVHMLRGGKMSLRGELARAYFRQMGRVAPQQALSDALATLEGFAHEQEPTTLYQRVAKYDGALWLDLGCNRGRAVRIEAGGWMIDDEPPVRFKRTPLTGVLPTPVRGGQLDELWSWVPAEPADRPLVAAYLVAVLMPDIAHPVLGLFGEQGSGKTTAMKALTLAVDPGPVPIRKPPRDAESWVTAASSSWVVALDNLSHVPDWLSDTLCRAVTGEGDVRRRLYSDSDLATFAFRRVVALTGIDLGSLNGDLADRLLPVHLARIPESARREETTMWGCFWEEAHPRILGAILALAVDVLDALRTTTLQRMPRMADFARVVHAVDQVLGTSGLSRYLGAQGRLAADTISGDDFVVTLSEVIVTRFEGTAADLLKLVTPTEDGWRKPRGWPANARLVTQRLRRLAPVLRQVGWEVENDGGHNKSKSAQWTLMPPTPSEMTNDLDPPGPPDLPQRQGRNGEVSQGGPGGSEAGQLGSLTLQVAASDSSQEQASHEVAGKAGQAGEEAVRSPVDLVSNLVVLHREALRARYREVSDSIADRVDIPTLITSAARTQPVQATAAVMMLADDLNAGRDVAPWLGYLAIACDAFDSIRKGP
jgi:hypothetical protein